MHRILLTCLLWMAVGSRAVCAAPAVKTNLLAITLAGTVDDLYLRSRESVLRLGIASGSLGTAVEYEGGKELAFFGSAEAAATPDKSQPLARVTVPENSQRVLLVFLKQKDSPLKVAAYDISENVLKDGDYRVFNFSPTKVLCRIGAEAAVVPPGEVITVGRETWRGEVSDLSVSIQLPIQGSRPAYSSLWGHLPSRRGLVFVYAGYSGADSVSVRRYYDVQCPSPKGQDERK